MLDQIAITMICDTIRERANYDAWSGCASFVASDDPEIMFDRYRPLVDDWHAFVEASRTPLPTCLWANTLRTTPQEVRDWLEREGASVEPLQWYPGGFRIGPNVSPGTLLPYLAGLYHVQEEVSLLPVAVLCPQPGMRVLDLCAAPGNKTAQVCVAVNNRGTVVANDRSGVRMNVVHRTLHRLGLCNVSTTVHDAAHFPIEPEGFDVVIADVPCSCEGTSRKHWDVVIRSSLEQSLQLGQTQLAILRRAVRLARPGGLIVYSTCTYAPEENEVVVDTVLRERSDLHLVDATIPGFNSSPAVTEWHGFELDRSLGRAVRVLPHQNDTGGFFLALMERRA